MIIGGGPAGLSAAYELAKLDFSPLVLEARERVGGLAATANYRGFFFDMGGHRFFTKVEEVRKIWHEILEDDLLRRPRLSRIYYNRRFFYYPLRPLSAMIGLGPWQSLLVVLSYVRWQCFPYQQEDTFEEWVTNRFGRRLFLTFFKTYTEKVWGIPCSELKAEWASQRIKDLSLKSALVSMFLNPSKTIKTLIQEFDYPRLGPGMMWDAMKAEIERRHGTVRLRSQVVRINRTGSRIHSVVVSDDGREDLVLGTDFVSSMPVTEFIKRLDPAPPARIVAAAEKLTYRDFLTVVLIVNKSDLFPDNWIYIHSPDVNVGRIQNFKNWSADMVPDPAKTSLGLEYFCAEGDALWNTPDADLIELGKHEVEQIGLATSADVEDGCVVRVPKAYPVYDSDYRDHLATVREFVDSLENFQTIGRNGLHRYNNQDHSMLTGMLAVRNMTLGQRHDLWSVNTDQEYHEEIRSTIDETRMDVHQLGEALQDAFAHVFMRLDRTALGLALGAASGIVLFLATLILVVTGDEVVGPRLGLLAQYFPGYTVTAPGSLLGLFYGFLTGFTGGWVFAFLRNVSVFLYLALVRRGVELQSLRRLLDYF